MPTTKFPNHDDIATEIVEKVISIGGSFSDSRDVPFLRQAAVSRILSKHFGNGTAVDRRLTYKAEDADMPDDSSPMAVLQGYGYSCARAFDDRVAEGMTFPLPFPEGVGSFEVFFQNMGLCEGSFEHEPGYIAVRLQARKMPDNAPPGEWSEPLRLAPVEPSKYEGASPPWYSTGKFEPGQLSLDEPGDYQIRLARHGEHLHDTMPGDWCLSRWIIGLKE